MMRKSLVQLLWSKTVSRTYPISNNPVSIYWSLRLRIYLFLKTAQFLNFECLARRRPRPEAPASAGGPRMGRDARADGARRYRSGPPGPPGSGRLAGRRIPAAGGAQERCAAGPGG